MLRARIIPCLLIQNKGLVKTTNFKNPVYVGDPINAVKIYNEKEVDELIVLDIDATVHKREPDFNLIRNLATECRMPFCYGGGITSVNHAKKIISLGAEKVALSSAALKNLQLLSDIGKAIGIQSVIVVLDIKKKPLLAGKGYDVYIKNGQEKVQISLEEILIRLNVIGIGEIVINSIDKDGTQSGYDLNLVEYIRNRTDVPITVLGGAGSLVDIKNLIKQFKIIGAAAGSIFVFKGKYKAVLINYPNKEEKAQIYNYS